MLKQIKTGVNMWGDKDLNSSLLIYELDLIDALQCLYKRMSSSGSRSPSRGRSRSPRRQEKNKLFITNLDGTANEKELEDELKGLFEKYGTLENLSVKKSRNGEYSFAFVEYQQGEDGSEAVSNLNNYQIRGKQMKVQHQDDSKRRKDPDKGCYTCGKKGHFARECRSSKNNSRGYRDRSESDDHRRKHRRRSWSYSSERSRNKHKKERKHKDRKEKKEKKEKKHRKHRRRSSSGSRS